MSRRAEEYAAQVLCREQLSDHFVRVVLGGPGLAGFASTGIGDEWVGLVVPGQFQSRYYTVRSWQPETQQLTLDIVVHEVGLVTEWARRDVVGETVTLSEPKGSFKAPESAQWLLLVGDLTGLPAMARIAEQAAGAGLPTRMWVEAPERIEGYLPEGADATWVTSPGEGVSALARVAEQIDWPEGEGYFWMAGESSQMRAIRKHLMRERQLPPSAYDVMGYWRAGAVRQPRSVDPGPVWRAGKAAGRTDAEIWADYDNLAAADDAAGAQQQ